MKKDKIDITKEDNQKQIDLVLKTNFDNAVNTVTTTATSIGNDARQLGNIIAGLRSPFVPHILLFRVIAKLVDVIDEELNVENPGPIVVGINTGISSIGNFIDNAKSMITDKITDANDEPICEQSIDNTLLSGSLSGWDFQNINDND
jgi:hypothetical protein